MLLTLLVEGSELVGWARRMAGSVSVSAERRRFDAAVTLIQNLPKEGPFQPSNEMKLKLYGLFKQATVGPCTGAKPGFWDVVARAKWEAWKGLGQMGPDEAMRAYVASLRQLSDVLPLDDDGAAFIASLPDEAQGEVASAVRLIDFDGRKPHANGGLKKGGGPEANGQSSGDSGAASDCEVVDERPLRANGRLPAASVPSSAASSAADEDEDFCDASDHLAPTGQETALETSASPLSSLSVSPSAEPFLLSGALPDAAEGRSRGQLLRELGDGEELASSRPSSHLPPPIREALAQSWDAIRSLHRARMRRRNLWSEEPLALPQGGGRPRKARGRGEERRAGQRGQPQEGSNGAGGSGGVEAAGAEEAGRPRREAGLGRSGSSSSESAVEVSWDPAVAGVLIRMNRELQGISRQLELMERILLAQQRLIQTNVDALVRLGSQRRLFFFGNLPWRTVGAILLWPVLLHFLLRLLSRPALWRLFQRLFQRRRR